MQVRTLYDPSEELAPEWVSEHSKDVYYFYGPAKGDRHHVIAIVYDMPGNTFVVNAESDIIARLSSTVPYPDVINPLFDITVRYVHNGIVKKATCVVPNPPGNTYAGHTIISRRPSARTWEELRKLEYQIAEPPPDEEPENELDDRRN